MNGILLTQDSTFIIGQVAWVLGKIMEGIFKVIDLIGIPNIGLAIIIFTIIVNLLMMPITIKQQKFSKLSSKLQPEIQAVQNKYKNRKDSDSQMAMNQEVQAVYAKYGVSPTGSCMYLIIQMPILFALYRVIYAMPAYVTKIGDTFRVLADKIMVTDGGKFITESSVDSIANVVRMYGRNITDTSAASVNGIIDVLNKLSSTDMAAVAEHYGLNDLTYNGKLILSSDAGRGLIDTYNNFLGLNIGNSPQQIIVQAFHVGAWLMIIGAVMIPLLSAVTQWLNVKLMPQQNTTPANANDQAATMVNSMKTMNMVMPLISAWFCFSLPAGMGLYWISSAVVRSVQQVIVNKHLDKVDFEELIKKNSEKSAKKLEKLKENQEKMNAYANIKTKSIQSKANSYNNNSNADNGATGSYRPAKEGSMMSKANMVRDFNEKNNKN